MKYGHFRNSLIAIILCLTTLHPVFSQFSMKGIVAEDPGGKPLTGAHVFLYISEDSLKNVVITSDDGSFLFADLPARNYLLKFSFMGYITLEKTVTIQNRNLDVGTVSLELKENPIGEVTITENIKAVTLSGDTLQFNADAYKTMPDATASDLAEKIPGVVIQDNKVQAQGEDVKEVLVDGRPFFGYDPATALNTLPAEVVEKIQIFDKESDQAEFTGFSTGETSKTMNIITRARMRNGSFGKVAGGYGSENKYMATGNYNIFNGPQRFSIIAQGNNINQQNFAFEDLLGVMAGGGRRPFMGGGGTRGGGQGRTPGGQVGGGMTSGGSVSDFMVQGQGGITETKAAGINYSDRWGEKIEVSASYFLNYSNNESQETLFREYLLSADSGQVYQETNNSESRNTNHRLNGKIEYKINDNNSILYRPRISIQQNDGMASFLGQSSLENDILNNIDNSTSSELMALNLGNNLLYRHKFGKKGRTVSIDFGHNITSNNGDKYLLNTTNYFYPFPLEELLDQNSFLRSNGWSANSSIAYTEPAGENGLVMLNYSAGYQENESEQETNNYDLVTERYIIFDTLLSNTFDNNYLTQRAGTSIQYRKGNLMLNSGITYQYAALQNSQWFPSVYEFENNYHNLLFNGMARIGQPQKKNLSLRYTASTDNPSLVQLQDVIDNSDPLQLRTGNSELDQANIHRVFLRYASVKAEKSRIFFAMIGGELRQNYIGNQTIYARNDITLGNGYILKEGTQLTRPVNLDGYMNMNSFITWGLPIQKLKLNLNLNISGIYSRRPGLVNDEVNYSNNRTGGLGLVISSNISEFVDYSISSQSNYNSASYSLGTQPTTEYFNQVTRFRFKSIVFKSLVIETSGTHQLYNGLSSSLDRDFFLLNAGIGKKVFKNKLGEIKLSVYDLLNQNQSLQRNLSDIYIEDSETLSLQRFVMFSFTYNIRNFNGDFPERPMRGPGMGPGMHDGPGPFPVRDDQY